MRWVMTFVALHVLLCSTTANVAQAQEDRATQLRLEIADLRKEEASVSQGGPVVMMIFGYVFAPLILVGPVMLMVGEVGCGANDAGCMDLTTPGLVLTGLGIAGAAVGIVGLVKATDNSNQRRYLRGRIKDKERELDSLSLHLGIHPQAATLQLRGIF